MGLISWLSRKLGGSTPMSGAQINEALEQYFNEVHIREVAFWGTVNLIANAVSKCEFQTYVEGKETKGAEYYLWNIEPNKNQNSSGFIHKWISKLYSENECLIIESNGQLFVADSYIRTPYALYDDVFSQVTIKDFTFNRTFSQSEVLFLSYLKRICERLLMLYMRVM